MLKHNRFSGVRIIFIGLKARFSPPRVCCCVGDTHGQSKMCEEKHKQCHGAACCSTARNSEEAIDRESFLEPFSIDGDPLWKQFVCITSFDQLKCLLISKCISWLQSTWRTLLSKNGGDLISVSCKSNRGGDLAESGWITSHFNWCCFSELLTLCSEKATPKSGFKASRYGQH